MNISIKEVIEIVGKEILWHEGNADKQLSMAYQKGFINGMIHIRQLLGQIAGMKDDESSVQSIESISDQGVTQNRMSLI